MDHLNRHLRGHQTRMVSLGARGFKGEVLNIYRINTLWVVGLISWTRDLHDVAMIRGGR